MADDRGDELLIAIAHELSNALTVIKGHAQLVHRHLSHGVPPEPAWVLRRMEVIDESAGRMTRLLGALRDYPGRGWGGEEARTATGPGDDD